MFKKFSINDFSISSSLNSIQKRLKNETLDEDDNNDDDDDSHEDERIPAKVSREMEKTCADRDHFRALATQLESQKAELEFRLLETQNKLRDDTNDSQRHERQPADGSEDNKASNEDLQRLRNHLIQVEEEYTKELIESQRKEQQLEAKNRHLEQQLTLLKQNESKKDQILRSLQTERDQALAECSQLEDKTQTNSSSVANLQLVIEQIQKENERKLAFVESKLEQQLELERHRTREAVEELRRQEERVQSTVEALGAASRLSETLDQKESKVAELRSEAVRKEQIIVGLKEELNQLKSSCESKVDKQVIKGLVIGYFLAPFDRKTDVQRLLARILDFNEQEMQKTGIIIGKRQKDQSLSQKFVEFLENESKPESKSNSEKELFKDFSKQLINSSQKQNPFLSSENQNSFDLKPIFVSTFESK